MKPHRFSRLWFTMKKKENHDYTLFDFLQFQREEKQKSISRNAGSRERIYSIPPIRISATGIFVILGVISIYEFIISNQICIVFTIFRLIWKQTEFRLVDHWSKKCKYNRNLVWFGKIPKRNQDWNAYTQRKLFEIFLFQTKIGKW